MTFASTIVRVLATIVCGSCLQWSGWEEQASAGVVIKQRQAASTRTFISQSLLWNLATARAVEYTPQGEILAKVLVVMLDPGGHEQEVA